MHCYEHESNACTSGACAWRCFHKRYTLLVSHSCELFHAPWDCWLGWPCNHIWSIWKAFHCCAILSGPLDLPGQCISCRIWYNRRVCRSVFSCGCSNPPNKCSSCHIQGKCTICCDVFFVSCNYSTWPLHQLSHLILEMWIVWSLAHILQFNFFTIDSILGLFKAMSFFCLAKAGQTLKGHSLIVLPPEG